MVADNIRRPNGGGIICESYGDCNLAAEDLQQVLQNLTGRLANLSDGNWLA
jgi:hypothetical protein